MMYFILTSFTVNNKNAIQNFIRIRDELFGQTWIDAIYKNYLKAKIVSLFLTFKKN